MTLTAKTPADNGYLEYSSGIVDQKNKAGKMPALFTRGQFWPLGIVVACVCPCVRQSWACLCDNSSQLPAWITKFGPKNAKYFAQGPYCFWDWLGLTFMVKFYFIEKFCLFASLLHLWNICETCLSNCSTSHMAPHTLSDYYMPTDRVTP